MKERWLSFSFFLQLMLVKSVLLPTTDVQATMHIATSNTQDIGWGGLRHICVSGPKNGSKQHGPKTTCHFGP